MKFVVACDSFKGCMSSVQVCRCIRSGIQSANESHTVYEFPMCDGGEGTAEIFRNIYHGGTSTAQVLDAYGKTIEVTYGIVPEQNMAIMEVASCIGLNMVEREKRNPMIANSRGVGLLLKDAVAKGYKKILLGIGGTSTTDGGMGMLQELGLHFFDASHRRLRAGIYSLGQVDYIDKRHFVDWNDVEILIAVDVNNHLLGKQGSAYTFGKQKGLYPTQLEAVDQAMRHYRDKIYEFFHVDINQYEGSGSSGGIGAVLTGLLHAKMVPGIQLCMQEYHLEDVIAQSDIVITGEGQSDHQTLYGKVPYGVGQLAKRHGKPVFCLSGALGIGYMDLYDAGFAGVFSSADRAMDFMTALKTGPQKLENLAYSITKTIDAIAKMK